MIKSLNRDDIQVTPFIAAKTWNLQNTDNNDLILWVSGSLTGSVALTYIDYGDGTTNPITNSLCNLALIPQSNNNVVKYQHGINNLPTFYPANSIYYDSGSNPQNKDGTYMNIVYDTYNKLFYNTYDDPTKLWGLENINLSGSNRILTDTMDVFSLNKFQFGDKIVPNSVLIQDNGGEIHYTITDDGNTNLILDGEYFSKFQTVTFESAI